MTEERSRAIRLAEVLRARDEAYRVWLEACRKVRAIENERPEQDDWRKRLHAIEEEP